MPMYQHNWFPFNPEDFACTEKHYIKKKLIGFTRLPKGFMTQNKLQIYSIVYVIANYQRQPRVETDEKPFVPCYSEYSAAEKKIKNEESV